MRKRFLENSMRLFRYCTRLYKIITSILYSLKGAGSEVVGLSTLRLHFLHTAAPGAAPAYEDFFPKASLRCLGSRLGVFREERGLSGRWEWLGLELQKWHGKRLRRGSEVWAVAESDWGWSCRNGMGRGYGGGARFERSLRVTGAGAAEMAWEEATEGERGLSGRWELLGLELQKWHGKRLRRGSEVWAVAGSYWGWSCRNGMGRGYGGGARFERSLRVTGAGAAEMAWEEATEGERGLSGRWELLGLELQKWHGKRPRRGRERGLSGRCELLGLELQKWHGKGERGLSGRWELLGLELQKWHGKGERGLSGRWELLGLELQKWHGKRLRRGSEVWAVAGSYWGWSCRNGMGRGYGGGARFERSLGVTGRNGMGRGYGGGARFERSLRVTGAGAAEMAWEEATEGERGLRGRWELLARRLRRGSEVWVDAESRWGWSCRNGMGGGYGGGARFECTLRSAGAGAAEMAWEEATEGERGLSGRWESLGLELQKWDGRRLRRGSEVWVYAESRWGWSCRNSMGGGYGGGARFECIRWGWRCRNNMGGGYGGGARSEGTLRYGEAGDAEIAWEDAMEGERGRRLRGGEGRWGWRCRNSMGGGYGGGARLEGKVCLQMGPEQPNQWKVESPIFWEKMGLYFCIVFGCCAQGDRYGMWCPV